MQINSERPNITNHGNVLIELVTLSEMLCHVASQPTKSYLLVDTVTVWLAMRY